MQKNCGHKILYALLCTSSLKLTGLKKDTPYKSYTTVLEFLPNQFSISLSKYAIKALGNIYRKKQYYKKAGVIVMGLTPYNNKQFMLFENENQAPNTYANHRSNQ